MFKWQNVMRFFNAETLLQEHQKQNRRKATGVDNVTKDQRRIRSILAGKTGVAGLLPESGAGLAEIMKEADSKPPEIVRFPIENYISGRTISFSLNGARFTVPEDIPASFLEKLLEAASHGAR